MPALISGPIVSRKNRGGEEEGEPEKRKRRRCDPD
jgi:hypothetical protein